LAFNLTSKVGLDFLEFMIVWVEKRKPTLSMKNLFIACYLVQKLASKCFISVIKC